MEEQSYHSFFSVAATTPVDIRRTCGNCQEHTLRDTEQKEATLNALLVDKNRISAEGCHDVNHEKLLKLNETPELF